MRTAPGFGKDVLARRTLSHPRRLAFGRDSRNSLGAFVFPSPFTNFFSPRELATPYKTEPS